MHHARVAAQESTRSSGREVPPDQAETQAWDCHPCQESPEHAHETKNDDMDEEGEEETPAEDLEESDDDFSSPCISHKVAVVEAMECIADDVHEDEKEIQQQEEVEPEQREVDEVEPEQSEVEEVEPEQSEVEEVEPGQSEQEEVEPDEQQDTQPMPPVTNHEATTEIPEDDEKLKDRDASKDFVCACMHIS